PHTWPSAPPRRCRSAPERCSLRLRVWLRLCSARSSQPATGGGKRLFMVLIVSVAALGAASLAPSIAASSPAVPGAPPHTWPSAPPRRCRSAPERCSLSLLVWLRLCSARSSQSATGVDMRRFMVLIVSVAALGAASLAPSIADAAFPQCPAVDHDTSCQFLITVTDKGVQVAQDPSQGPYDGEDDALIGIQHSSSRAISSIPLSAENGLFGFESDGICSPGSAPVAPGCVVLFKNSSGNLTEHP